MTARIAIIGAGGLGGPIAYALAYAGAHLVLCDDDVVELSNLQRQIHFKTADIGRLKVEALADELVRRGHPPEQFHINPQRFTADSAAMVMQDVDILVDGSDSFATKFEVNDQALAAGMPFVIGSIARYSGQILAIDPSEWPRIRPRTGPSDLPGRRPAQEPGAGPSAPAPAGAAPEPRSWPDTPQPSGCYRCLFEQPPSAEEGQTCADAGVLGATVAVIAGLAARLALALARGRRLPGDGPLWVIEDLRATGANLAIRTVRYAPRAGCPACARVRTSTIRKELS